MSTQNDDSHDNAELDNDAQTAGEGPRMTRRRMLQATAATGAAATVGTAGIGNVAAQTDDEGDWRPETPDEAKEYIKQDNGHYQMWDADVRRSVGLALLTAGAPAVAAPVVGATAIGPLNEFFFGPHNPETQINEDAHNSAYAHIGDSAISLRDSLAVWEQNDLEALEYLAYSIMEAEAVRALNDKETRGTAKTIAKQKIRDEVIVTPERNLLRLSEGIGIRIRGTFWVWQAGLNDDGYLADDDGDGELEARTNSYWAMDEADTSDKGEYIYQFNQQPSSYTLVNGEEIDLDLCQVVVTENMGYDDNDSETYDLMPVGDVDRFGVEPDRYGDSGTGTRSRWLLDDVGFYHNGEDDFRTVGDYITNQQITTLYNDLMTLKDTLENEVEQYVDALYDEYSPGDVVDPGDRTPGGLTYESGSNYAETGNSNYAEIWAALTGLVVDSDAGDVTIEEMAGGEVADTYTGVLIPQADPGNLPRVQYAAEDYSIDPSAGDHGEITIDRASVVPGGQTYEWNDSSGTTHTVTIANDDLTEIVNSDDEVTGHLYAVKSGDDAPGSSSDIESDALRSQIAGMTTGQTSTAYTYVAGEEENDDGDLEGKMYEVDPSQSDVDKWRVKSIESQWYVAFERPREKTTEINNDELEKLWNKYEELASKQDETDEEEGKNVAAGGAGAFGNLDNPLLLAAGGGIAALLAALGISGAGDGDS